MLFAGLKTIEQCLLDVRHTGCGEDRRHDVFMRRNTIQYSSGRDFAGPANGERYAETTFPAEAFLTAKWRGAAIRPGELLGAVIGREDYHRVVSYAEVVQLFEKLA